MNSIVKAKYVAENGTELVVGQNAEVLAQVDGGAVPITGYSLPAVGTLPLPRQLRPRRAILFNPAGKRREVICLTNTCPMWVGTTITLNIEDSDGASTVYTRDQLRQESWRARRKAA